MRDLCRIVEEREKRQRLPIRGVEGLYIDCKTRSRGVGALFDNGSKWNSRNGIDEGEVGDESGKEELHVGTVVE